MKRRHLPFLLGGGIIIVFTIAYILLLLNRYWQFDFFFVDNVLFDTALWKVAQGVAPIVNHTALGKINILGDHFHPTIFLFSLLYLLSSRQEVILIGMSVIYGLSAFLAMFVGFRLIPNKLTTLALLLAYFTYVGTQNAMIYGFHELNLMPLFFFLAVFGLVRGKIKLYYLGLALLLLTKESFAALSVTLGFFIFLAYPQHRKTAVATIFLSIIYFLLVTRIVIPSFSGRYIYGETGMPTSLEEAASKLVSPSQKITTFTISMLTFALLPILNFATLPMVLQDFVLRYLFTLPGTVQYSLDYHYNLALAPLLLFASIWTLHSWSKNKKLHWVSPLVSGLLIVITLYFFRFARPAWPLRLVINYDFYQDTVRNRFLWELVEKTPDDGKVMTQNNLGYPLAHLDVYPFATDMASFKIINPKYVVFDLRPGQNPNNFSPLTRKRAQSLFNELIQSQAYSIIFQKSDMYILGYEKKQQN